MSGYDESRHILPKKLRVEVRDANQTLQNMRERVLRLGLLDTWYMSVLANCSQKQDVSKVASQPMLASRSGYH